MDARPPLPPKYSETHHYVFDRRTGDVLATETIWIEEGVEPGTRRTVRHELLASLAADAGKKPADLDVIEGPAPVGRGRVRVDVATRQIVVEVRDDQDSPRTAAPERLKRP
jgi:hypothetical protein